MMDLSNAYNAEVTVTCQEQLLGISGSHYGFRVICPFCGWDNMFYFLHDKDDLIKGYSCKHWTGEFERRLLGDQWGDAEAEFTFRSDGELQRLLNEGYVLYASKRFD